MIVVLSALMEIRTPKLPSLGLLALSFIIGVFQYFFFFLQFSLPLITCYSLLSLSMDSIERTHTKTQSLMVVATVIIAITFQMVAFPQGHVGGRQVMKI